MHPHTNVSPRQTGHTETTKPGNLKLLSEDPDAPPLGHTAVLHLLLLHKVLITTLSFLLGTGFGT